MNLCNKRSLTIQVKGSKAYKPKRKNKELYGEGSNGWFFVDKFKIKNNTADYFIFNVHIISDNLKKGRKELSTHLIIIKPKDLYRICKKKKILHKRFSFYIWVNPKEKKAFDFRDSNKKGIVDFTDYLDENGIKSMKKYLV